MLYEIIATGFYLGRLPAPGTVGTLLGAGIAYLVSFNLWTIAGTGAVLFVLGLLSAEEVIRRTGDPDPEQVIIDEVVGFLACFVLVEFTPKTALVAFLLFRIIDIFKPFPVNLFDRIPGAVGVMLDDLAAGLMTSFLLFLLLE
jgi:phosphatidylglycerophosphatase A